MNKRFASIAVAAAALGGTAALVPAVADAQDEAPAEEETSGEPGSHVEDALQPFVADGTLTQAEADEIADALREARPERGLRQHGFHSLETLTEVLGIDAETLREELSNGRSLADIAGENDVAVETVIDALMDDANARIDEAVEEGRLDEAEAEEKRAELEEAITARVNGEVPEDGFGPRGRVGPDGPDDPDD